MCSFQPFFRIRTYFIFKDFYSTLKYTQRDTNDHLDLPALCAPIYRRRALAIEPDNYNHHPPLEIMYSAVYYVVVCPSKLNTKYRLFPKKVYQAQ